MNDIEDVEVAQLSGEMASVDGEEIMVIEAVMDGQETFFIDMDDDYELAIVNTDDLENPASYQPETGVIVDELSEQMNAINHSDLAQISEPDYSVDFDNSTDMIDFI